MVNVVDMDFNSKYMFYIVTCTLVVVVSLVVILQFLNSSDWNEAAGRIVHSEIVELDLQYNDRIKTTGGVIDYQVKMLYSYEVNGVEYKGDTIYAGFNNIFPDFKSASEMVERFSSGSDVTLYYDPESPAQSCLISSKSIGVKQKIVLGFVLLFGFGLVFGGIYVFYKYL